MKEAAATNDSEGTVSKKTQVSLELIEQGMALLQNNLKRINENYLGDVDLRTLIETLRYNGGNGDGYVCPLNAPLRMRFTSCWRCQGKARTSVNEFFR